MENLLWNSDNVEKPTKFKDEIALFQSYNDSLKKVLKIEEELQTLRKTSASIISNLKSSSISKNAHSENGFTNRMANITNSSVKCLKNFVQNDTNINYTNINDFDKKIKMKSCDENLFSNKMHYSPSYNKSIHNKVNSPSKNGFYQNQYLSDSHFEKELKTLKSKRLNSKIEILHVNQDKEKADVDFSYHEVEELYKSFQEYHPVSLAKQLNRIYHDLINQHTRDEELLSKYFDIVLNIREKAVIKSAKCELLRLKIKNSSAFEQLSSLKRKQRGLLIKLQHEYNEIKLMKKFQKKLFDERKKVLVKQLKHFTTIIGSNENTSTVRDNINLKSSICAKSSSKKLPVKCYSTVLKSEYKHDINKRCSILMNHKKTFNSLLLLYFDLQLNKTALNLIDQNSSSTEIVTVLKELSQKSTLNLDQEKSFKNHIFPIIYDTTLNSNDSHENDARNSFKSQIDGNTKTISNLTIVPTESKIITDNNQVSCRKREVFSVWGNAFTFNYNKLFLKRNNVSNKENSLYSDYKALDFLFVNETLGKILFSIVILNKYILYNPIIYKKFIFYNYVKDFIKRIFVLFHYFLEAKRFSVAIEFPVNIKIIEFCDILKCIKYKNVKENNSIINAENISLSYFSELIENLEQMYIEKQRLKKAVDTKINTMSSHLCDSRRECIFLSISTKENYSLETTNLQCFISKNRPTCGKFYDYIHTKKLTDECENQIWDIYYYIVSVPYCENMNLEEKWCDDVKKSTDVRHTTQKEILVLSDIPTYSKLSDMCEQSDDEPQKLIVKPNKKKSGLSKQLSEINQINKRKSELHTDNPEQISGTKILSYVTSRTINQLEEAEELRRKQLAIEMEIKALLEQQSSQVPYFVMREIPDKPPPPYIPPEDKSDGVLIKNSFFKNGAMEKNKKVMNIIEYSYENIWLLIMSKTYSVDSDMFKIIKNEYISAEKHNKLNANNRFLFDLCNELFCQKYNNINKKVMPWEYKNIYRQSKNDICKSVETATMQSLGFGNKSLKDNIFINCAHKLQDHVDELLVRELQEEEVEWIDIEEYEMNIKNMLTEKILNELLNDTIKIYLKIVEDE